MSTVRYDMSMSLDGFVAGPEVAAEQGLGVGGERLHTWVITDPDEQAVALLDQTLERMGAMLTGRRNYDISRWGPDGPAGPRRIPVFVLTHRVTPGRRRAACTRSSPTSTRRWRRRDRPPAARRSP